MKGSLEEEIREKLLKSFLDTAILVRLEHGPMNGYDLNISFTKKFGVIISTSTAYQALVSMERDTE